MKLLIYRRVRLKSSSGVTFAPFFSAVSRSLWVSVSQTVVINVLLL